MASNEVRAMVMAAAAACEDKKAEDIRILELDASDAGFADFFLIASGTNERQTTAIADEVEAKLKREFGILPNSVEGRRVGEWVLIDYVDLVVHVFLGERRAYYDIERLRKSARPVDLEELRQALTKKTIAVREKAAAKKTAVKKAAVKKAVVKKAPVKVAAKPAKKAVAKKAPAAKKAVATKAAVAKSVSKKAPAGKATRSKSKA
ncbi:ribosome silencing factor [Silvibacterium sp.]|uniref:ribosome silencing factor n=1 Tax=Silvibacterium sp. TaxID=1964179 RepID=UPI0039E59CA5